MAYRGLFIGINKHQRDDIDELSFACRDAAALYALFADTLGEGGKLLLDQDATRNGIEEGFKYLADAAEDDLVIVYFSGHGTTAHALVSFDADRNNVGATCIPIDLLHALLDKIRSRKLIGIFDCCFSGGIGSKAIDTGEQSKGGDADDPLARLAGKGRIILTASLSHEKAWEHPRVGHGLFTHFLLEALQGPEEVRTGQQISLYRLLEYVTRRVSDGCRLFGKEQHPGFRGEIDGDVLLPLFVPGTNYKAAFPELSTTPATADPASLISLGLTAEQIAAWQGVIPSINDLQLAAINEFGVLRGEDIVVSAPTSSGKTLIGELAALTAINQSKRALFLFPLKALVADKYEYFQRTYGPTGIRTIRATGDYSDDLPALNRGAYEICLMTYEKFAGLALAAPHIVEQLGAIVIDEAQMIADKSRGVNLEFVLTILLMRRKQGVSAQLVLLSAVIGKTNGLEQWIGGRLLKRTVRPVPLIEGILEQGGSYRHLDANGVEKNDDRYINVVPMKGSSQDIVIPLVRKLVADGGQVIVFRESKGETRGCAKYLAGALTLPSASRAISQLPEDDLTSASQDLHLVLLSGVAFHNADLERLERTIIEEEFRKRDSQIRVIVATTTLAMGINTPAEAVIVVGLTHPGPVPAPYAVAEYKNIIGRSGRLGFSAKGHSFLVASSVQEERRFWDEYVMGVPENLESRFLADGSDPRSLVVRILAVARTLNISKLKEEELIDFIESSFGAFQRKRENAAWKFDRAVLRDAIGSLSQNRLLTVEPTDSSIYLTDLGWISAEGVVEVESVVRLAEVIRNLNPADLTEAGLVTLAQITVEMDNVYFPMNRRSTHKEPQFWPAQLRGQGVPNGITSSLSRWTADSNQATARAKKAVSCLLWMSEMPMAQIEKVMTQFGGSFDGAAGPIRGTSQRTRDIIMVVTKIARFFHPEHQFPFDTDHTALRLELGIPSDTIQLAKSLGDRVQRADYLRLRAAGIQQISHFIEMAEEAVATLFRTPAILRAVQLLREKFKNKSSGA